MEFFERAHVSKGSKCSRKDKKSEETVKKQLKKILYGYQHSDNALIKDSSKTKSDLEDSSSVSGYSDLNLTNSSIEGNATHETVSSNGSEESMSGRNNLTLDASQNSDIIEDPKSQSSLSVDSTSDYDDNTNSLSGHAPRPSLKTALKFESEKESIDSFVATSTDLDSISDEESDFDANGVLAAKILEKINKINKGKEKKNSKKVKREEMEEAELGSIHLSSSNYNGPFRPQTVDDDVNMDCLSLDISDVSLSENKEFICAYRPNEWQSNDSSRAATSDESMSQSQDSSTHSNPALSPFVSVLATDMNNECLTDILGEYRHPTIRNLPSDSNNAFSSNAGLFKTEDVNVVDIQTEEDVCSLVPEIDNDPVVEEIDLEMATSETSVEPLEESTTYEDALQSEVSEREPSTDSIDPTLVNPVKVYYGKNNQCIFVLKHPAELYIHGKVKVKSLGGSIEVLGYTLQDKQREIYAPNYNYAQYIRTVEKQNAYYGLFGKVTSAGISVQEAEDIVISIGEYDGIVCMQPLKSRQMDYVENNFSSTDLFSKPNKNIDNCFKKASEMLGCSLYLSRPWKSFEENYVWKQAITCGFNDLSRGIVCGGKGVGKSTFLRYYVNKLLANGPVLVIDLDPGQCEFTVAGNVSATVVTEPLLGPNFTHLKTPDLMLNVGMINTMDNPRRYVAAIETLISHCRNNAHLNTLPWIINTMGMTNTVGLKFITYIILQARPTFLIQIDSKSIKKRYDFHLYPQTVKNLYFEDYQTDPLFTNVNNVNVDYEFFLSHHTDNGVKSNFSLPPRDERYLNYLAYFGELLNVRGGSLLSIVPYQVNLRDLKIGLNVKIKDQAVTKVINGKVVALCQTPPNTKSVFTLGDVPLKCFGAGVVRGIDREKGILYVVTPVAAGRLPAVDCALYADWAPELRGAEGVEPGTPLPYRTAANYHQRQFMFTPKRRFNPLQLLKMSRSS